MSDCEFQLLLPAYHDGELDAESHRRVEAHLDRCATCALELAGLRALSLRIAVAAPAEVLDPGTLKGMHEAVDRAAAAESYAFPLLRTASLLAALAASVLIVGGVWLLDLRDDREPAASTASVGSDAMVAVPSDWERIAVTLRAEPRPGAAGDSPFSPHYAAAIDWMIEGLVPSSEVRTEGKPWAVPKSF